MNANGQGVAAAMAMRIRADGSIGVEEVARWDVERRAFVASPLDLGGPNDQVILLLFGTGVRYCQSLSDVSVYIGGVPALPMALAAQGQYEGLDQINISLPQGLRGRGEVEIDLTVEGRSANKVTVSVR